MGLESVSIGETSSANSYTPISEGTFGAVGSVEITTGLDSYDEINVEFEFYDTTTILYIQLNGLAVGYNSLAGETRPTSNFTTSNLNTYIQTAYGGSGAGENKTVFSFNIKKNGSATWNGSLIPSNYIEAGVSYMDTPLTSINSILFYNMGATTGGKYKFVGVKYV